MEHLFNAIQNAIVNDPSTRSHVDEFRRELSAQRPTVKATEIKLLTGKKNIDRAQLEIRHGLVVCFTNIIKHTTCR